MTKTTTLLFILMLLASQSALGDGHFTNHGLRSPSQAHFLFGGGLTLGGETLGTAVYTDGSTTDIDSGDLIHFYAGILYDTPGFQIQSTLGYHFDSASDGDTSVSFNRYPLEFLMFLKSGQVRVGGGISYHLNPELDQSDFGLPDVEFKNALGTVFQGGFNLASTAWLDFRYVFIEYDVERFGSTPVSGSVDGDHFGLYISVHF